MFYRVITTANTTDTQHNLDDPCGNGYGPLEVIVNTSYSYIQSPNYPNNYSTNANCSWIIMVDNGQGVTVRMVDISLENGYVVVYTIIKSERIL